jgi:hypothetical protein
MQALLVRGRVHAQQVFFMCLRNKSSFRQRGTWPHKSFSRPRETGRLGRKQTLENSIKLKFKCKFLKKMVYVHMINDHMHNFFQVFLSTFHIFTHFWSCVCVTKVPFGREELGLTKVSLGREKLGA